VEVADDARLVNVRNRSVVACARRDGALVGSGSTFGVVALATVYAGFDEMP